MRSLLVVLLFLLAEAGASATVVMAVATTDGVLVCEDTRLTMTDPQGKVTYSDGTHKLQAFGGGVVALAGQVSRSARTNELGLSVWSLGSYDLLSEISSFFQLKDIRSLDPWDAAELESRLENRLQSTSIGTFSTPSVQAVMFMVWADSARHLRMRIGPDEFGDDALDGHAGGFILTRAG